jgi:hypothetical protein
MASSSITKTTTTGTQTFTESVINIALVMLGALMLPMYYAIYKYDPRIFNMLQCAHVICISLYALLYVNYIKKQCFAVNELRYRAYNWSFIYTMFIFFGMFLFYIGAIFWSRFTPA